MPTSIFPELSSEAVVDALRLGTGDFGIVADYVDTTGLVVRPWVDDHLVALVPTQWRERQRTISFRELLEHPLIGLPRDSGLSRFLAAQASHSGRIPTHRVRLSSFEGIAQVVAEGVGRAGERRSAAPTARNPARFTVDSWAQRKLLIRMTAQGVDLPSAQALADALQERAAAGL